MEFVILVGALVVVSVRVEADSLAVLMVLNPLSCVVNQLVFVVVSVQLNSIAVSHWLDFTAVFLRGFLNRGVDSGMIG